MLTAVGKKLTILLYSLLAGISLTYGYTTDIIIPASPQSGPSNAKFVSSTYGLDAPKVTPINATSFDWWYFDAVSLDSNASIVVTFFTSAEAGFPVLGNQTAVDSVAISASFPNGTLVSVNARATEAVVEVDSEGQGSSGVWNGTGMDWEGSNDLSRYVIKFDSPSLGVQGTVVFTSIVPAHYPCGPVVADQNMEVSPQIGWSNAIPDSIAAVNVSFGTSNLQFIGSGYHDKNWGNQPFAQSVGSWYWGHGRLGPYSIVWFDVLDPNGTEYLSAYAANNGSIVSSQCGGIKVRPTGANSTYPPVQSSGNPEGFHIDLDLGDTGVLEVNVTNAFVIEQGEEVYTRWLGKIDGGLNGTNSWKGVSLHEEFRLLA